MFDQGTVHTGIRFEVLCGLFCFFIVFLIYLSGGNPYGLRSLLSYLVIPFFLFAGLTSYRSIQEESLSFGKAFAVAFSISLYTAITSAMLLYVFATLVGPEVMQRHVAETGVLMESARQNAVEILGQQAFDQAYADLGRISPLFLANEDFVRRIVFGLMVSVFAALFKRKT